MLFQSFVSLIVLGLFSKCHAAPSAGFRLCNVSHASIDIPAGSTLPAPIHTTSYLGLGVGTQNYTCTSAGSYTNVGALAEIYDISCLYGSPIFYNISSVTFNLWNSSSPSVSSSQVISAGHIANPSSILGEHYFVVNPISGTGVAPKWDFTSHAFSGNPAAFVVGSKNATFSAPTSKSDVDWLYLKELDGSLADELYRTDTRGGQPPTSCTPGSDDITVKYTAIYWLNGGSPM